MVTGIGAKTGALTTLDLVNRVTGYGQAAQEFINENSEQTNPLARYLPFTPLDEMEIENWTRQGAGGVMGVARSAAIPATKAVLRKWRAQIYTDKYAYLLTNEVLEKATDDLAAQDALDANIFFGAAKFWKQVTALVAGAGKSIASSAGTWENVSAEGPIVEALTYLDDMGYTPGMGPRLVIYPARAGAGLLQSRSIRGTVDSTANIIKSSFPDVLYIPYAPWRSMNNEFDIDILAGTDSDALGTNAIIAIGNPAWSIKSGEYNFKKTPNVFVDVIGDEGYNTVLHRANGCMVQKLRSSSSSATTNPYIVKITGAAASR